MERRDWLDKWRVRRARVLAESQGGLSWNDLARKYHVSVTAIGKLIKRARKEQHEQGATN